MNLARRLLISPSRCLQSWINRHFVVNIDFSHQEIRYKSNIRRWIVTECRSSWRFPFIFSRNWRSFLWIEMAQQISSRTNFVSHLLSQCKHKAKNDDGEMPETQTTHLENILRGEFVKRIAISCLLISDGLKGSVLCLMFISRVWASVHRRTAVARRD